MPLVCGGGGKGERSDTGPRHTCSGIPGIFILEGSRGKLLVILVGLMGRGVLCSMRRPVFWSTAAGGGGGRIQFRKIAGKLRTTADLPPPPLRCPQFCFSVRRVVPWVGGLLGVASGGQLGASRGGVQRCADGWPSVGRSPDPPRGQVLDALAKGKGALKAGDSAPIQRPSGCPLLPPPPPQPTPSPQNQNLRGNNELFNRAPNK